MNRMKTLVSATLLVLGSTLAVNALAAPSATTGATVQDRMARLSAKMAANGASQEQIQARMDAIQARIAAKQANQAARQAKMAARQAKMETRIARLTDKLRARGVSEDKIQQKVDRIREKLANGIRHPHRINRHRLEERIEHLTERLEKKGYSEEEIEKRVAKLKRKAYRYWKHHHHPLNDQPVHCLAIGCEKPAVNDTATQAQG